MIVKYEYDSFGNILSIKDANNQLITDTNNIGIINPFRYRGYYYDKEIELYYLNSRYYNPKWGRFLNADGIIGANNTILGQNSFLYTDNNFINMIDIKGMFSDLLPNLSGILDATKEALGIIGQTATAIGAGIGAIVSTGAALVTPIIYAVGTFATLKFLDTIYEHNKKIKKEESKDRNHNVYVLIDKTTEMIVYVGRTKNLDNTRNRHHKNPARNGLELKEVKTNLTRTEARALEQTLIERCNTLYPAPYQSEYRKFNQINGISKRNQENYNYFKKISATLLEENEIPC